MCLESKQTISGLCDADVCYNRDEKCEREMNEDMCQGQKHEFAGSPGARLMSAKF